MTQLSRIVIVFLRVEENGRVLMEALPTKYRLQDEISPLCFTLDSQLLHPRMQRGRLESQELGRAVLPTDAPTRHVQDLEHVVSFDLSQLRCRRVS